MKSQEYVKELRALDEKAMTQRIQELQAAIDRSRVDAVFGKAKSNQAVALLRQQLAQAKTITNERRLIAEEQESK